MAKFLVPSTDSVNQLLEMVVQNGTAAEGAPGEAAYAAEFVDDEAQLVSVCLADLRASAALGCALSMIPPAGAEDMCKEGQLSEMAEANLYEVMNIFSTLFMNNDTPHLKLERVVPAGESEAVQALADCDNASFELELAAYGKGIVSFYTH